MKPQLENEDQTTGSGKSINKLMNEEINGNEIIGGDKTIVPITVAPSFIDVADSFTVSGVILPDGHNEDFAPDQNPKIMTNGSTNLS